MVCHVSEVSNGARADSRGLGWNERMHCGCGIM